MTKLFKTILLVLTVTTLSASAQGRAVDARLKKIANEFDAMVKADREAYIKLKKKAFEDSRNEKFLSCLVAISDARKIFAQDMDLLFLNGLCLAEIHDVDNAISFYVSVLEINPHHMFTLLNMIEINFFAGRYKEAIKYITKVNSILDSRANGQDFPLIDFKHLICLYKLSEKEPDKYGAEINKLNEKFTYMDDNPFYYYANALKSFDAGDKQEGLIWILKAYLIFKEPKVIETWNKALVDTGYIGAHEIMFNKVEQE